MKLRRERPGQVLAFVAKVTAAGVPATDSELCWPKHRPPKLAAPPASRQ